ncbi:Imm1 family immunity protein [Sorangium sp. So ce185]|uniref:Imm1 family immunity protein n=1 Tax=Sorangium sp. So ce185 TaxID=3133287 RepID=UPI003F606C99
MKASWGTSETTVESREDLYAMIETVRRSGQPTMVFLQAANGNVLVLGVGQDESVLTFAQPDGTSFHSLGNRERKGYLLFRCRDQVDEFMTEMAVPEDDAIVAAEQFLATGERPPAVQWEPDW